MGESTTNYIRAKTYLTPTTDCTFLCIKLFKYPTLNCNFYFILSFHRSVIWMWLNWCFCFSNSEAWDFFFLPSTVHQPQHKGPISKFTCVVGRLLVVTGQSHPFSAINSLHRVISDLAAGISKMATGVPIWRWE